MPAELPGFYFDAAKNRYFPLSSKPKSAPPQPGPIPILHDHSKADHSLKPKRRRISSWSTARTTSNVGRRYRAAHDVVCSQYADTVRSFEHKIPVFGRIKSFATTVLTGNTHRFIGDSRGWLYTSNFENTHDIWQADLNLHPESEVSSICISGSRCIATCFGPSAKIAVQDLNVAGRTSLVSLNGIHDIWSSHLQGPSLVLGVTKKAVYMSDIDTSMSVQDLETQSDVFTVWQHDNMIFAGCRNGSIIRFDKRLGKRGQRLYTDRFLTQQRTSVLHLEVLSDSCQLLSSHMNGDLMTYDLRFTREASPLVQYQGHRNTYTQKLGIALDPSQEFLFAAGEDHRIRGWSVHTGSPLIPSPSHGPFSAVYPDVVEAMQVTNEPEGLCLWAGFDKTLHQIYLGQR